MTHPDRPADDRLDRELRALAREIEPGRDLWPDVAARLESRERGARRAWAWHAAAAVLLVAASSLLTATWLDRTGDHGKMAVTPAAGTTASGGVGVLPATFDGGRLDPEYLAARTQLTAMLETRMASLPESTRAKLQVNLAEMRRAADEINAALDEQPGDPLLEELLLKTYQDELAVLANVNQLTNVLTNTAGAPADGKRMQL